MKDFFEQKRPHNGLTYEEYKKEWEADKNRSMKELDAEERKMMHYLRYNWKRSEAVEDAFSPSDELTTALASIDQPQLWMVITEPWCGDSAFCLPVVQAAAEQNEDVELRILHRDENLDVMDQYLTGGSRSIPKLVAFGQDGDEQFTWGPRPDRGQRVYDNLKEKGHDKQEIVKELIAWYEDGGYEHVDTELTSAITSETAAA